MYHLTKEILNETNKREEIFRDLLISDYSPAAILRYRDFYEADFAPENKNRHIAADLGFSLRHLLAAMALKAKERKLRIFSEVIGSGVFWFPYDWFTYCYAGILADAARLASDRCVQNQVELHAKGLQIQITYFGTRLPKLYRPFYGCSGNHQVKIGCAIPLKQMPAGKRQPLYEFLTDRLSPVNLAFIQRCPNQGFSTAHAVHR